MSGDLVIGLDAGTSVIKAVAFDLGGRQVADHAVPNSYEEHPGGVVEQDMARTWADAARVLRGLADIIDRLPQRTVALAVTGQGDGTWLADGAGQPVAPAWLWLDSRAADYVDRLDASGVRAENFRRTGCGLNACQQSVHLMWLAEHAPELLDGAATAFHCKDWLYLNLTGERVTDVSEGTFTFGNFRERAYAEDVVRRLGLEGRRHLLPPMIDGSIVTHGLTQAAAGATGLRAGTPVSLGYVDVICSSLSVGLYDPDATVGCTIAGSTGMHMRWFPEAGSVALADRPTGYTMPFPVPGSAAQMQSNMASSLNIDWIVDIARQAAEALGRTVERKDALLALDARVADAPAGAALMHPYIHEAGERGPFVDVAARAMFTGLSTRVGFDGLLRAVYEGLGFAAVDCYRAMGALPDEVRMTGGAARSGALRQIMADCLNTPVREIDREEAGAAGASMMALVAVGAEPDMAACVRRWVTPRLGARLSPDAGRAALYRDLFEVYLETRRAMAPVWSHLAEIRERRRL